jgi:4'-phosphopantetheinyl transferase EntD
VHEFAAGRLCARRALAELGIGDFPLRAGADRSPCWPPTVVGSISHTLGFCGAVVGERRRFVSLGLDIEAAQDLKQELWPRVCTDAELRWIASLPAPSQASAATLVFCAKEAFYKCQYPVTGERLSFDDVHVEIRDSDGAHRSDESGELTITATRSLALADSAGIQGRQDAGWRGKYRVRDGYVCVGVALEVSS